MTESDYFIFMCIFVFIVNLIRDIVWQYLNVHIAISYFDYLIRFML